MENEWKRPPILDRIRSFGRVLTAHGSMLVCNEFVGTEKMIIGKKIKYKPNLSIKLHLTSFVGFVL